MKKLVLLFFSLFILLSHLDAQRCCCYGCRRYMDPTLANDEALPYGYVDNINYPDPYALPINYYFNYCPPCPRDYYNATYLKGCIRYSNRKNAE